MTSANGEFNENARPEGDSGDTPNRRVGDVWGTTADALFAQIQRHFPDGDVTQAASQMLLLYRIYQAEVEKNEALRRKIEALNHRVYTDTTTGIPNREFFNQELELAVSGARIALEAANDNKLPRRALVIVDLAGLTVVNKKLGQDGGDVAIWAGAHLLEKVARRGEGPAHVGEVELGGEDDTAARIGGDEYAMILIDGSGNDNFAEGAKARIEGMLEGACFEYDGVFYPLTFYVAIEEIDGTQDAEAVFKAAGKKLYEAKAAANHDRHSVDLAPVDPGDVTGPLVRQPHKVDGKFVAHEEDTDFHMPPPRRRGQHERPARPASEIEPKATGGRVMALRDRHLDI